MRLRLLAAIVLSLGLYAANFHSDIEFAKPDGVSLRMDVSIPDGRGPFPAVIVVHGGAWQQGDKGLTVQPFFAPLTEAGFAWFSVNYRLAPAHRYPAAVDDVVAAIRFISSHASEYKVDTRRLSLLGESAGGQIVALIGARYARELGIAAVVPFYPPTDLDALVEGNEQTPNARRAVMQFLGITELNPSARALLREASPLTYVHAGMPPYLFVHGTEDATVSIHQSERMCAEMKKADADCEVRPVPGAPHWIVNWEKNPALTAYKKEMTRWLLAKLPEER